MSYYLIAYLLLSGATVISTVIAVVYHYQMRQWQENATYYREMWIAGHHEEIRMFGIIIGCERCNKKWSQSLIDDAPKKY